MERIQIKNRGLETVSMLFHGMYNTGKTHLMGAALDFESQYGPALFIGVGDEPFIPTLQGVDGNFEVIHAFDYADLDAIVAEYASKGLRAIALDSVLSVSDACVRKVTGGDRPPGVGEGNHGQREWGHIKHDLWVILSKFRRLAPYFFASCPSSVTENEVTKDKSVAPDLIGKQSLAIVGRFEYVGYVTAETLGGGRVKRAVHFEPYGRIATRCNLPKKLSGPIALPEGNGGWPAIKTVFQSTFEVKP